MSSTCCWEYYLPESALQCQCSSYGSYTWKIEHIYVVFVLNTLQLPCLWKVVHIPLCSIDFLPVCNRSGTIPIEKWCDTNTSSITPAAIFTTCEITNASATYSTTYTANIKSLPLYPYDLVSEESWEEDDVVVEFHDQK